MHGHELTQSSIFVALQKRKASRFHSSCPRHGSHVTTSCSAISTYMKSFHGFLWGKGIRACCIPTTTTQKSTAFWKKSCGVVDWPPAEPLVLSMKYCCHLAGWWRTKPRLPKLGHAWDMVPKADDNVTSEKTLTGELLVIKFKVLRESRILKTS